jgi:hypothetical protein
LPISQVATRAISALAAISDTSRRTCEVGACNPWQRQFTSGPPTMSQGAQPAPTKTANRPMNRAAFPRTSAVVSLAAGFAMIPGHNLWYGGTLPVAFTLVGWLILATEALTQLLGRMQYGEHYAFYIAPSLMISLFGPASPPIRAENEAATALYSGTTGRIFLLAHGEPRPIA